MTLIPLLLLFFLLVDCPSEVSLANLCDTRLSDLSEYGPLVRRESSVLSWLLLLYEPIKSAEQYGAECWVAVALKTNEKQKNHLKDISSKDDNVIVLFL